MFEKKWSEDQIHRDMGIMGKGLIKVVVVCLLIVTMADAKADSQAAAAAEAAASGPSASGPSASGPSASDPECVDKCMEDCRKKHEADVCKVFCASLKCELESKLYLKKKDKS